MTGQGTACAEHMNLDRTMRTLRVGRPGLGSGGLEPTRRDNVRKGPGAAPLAPGGG